VRIHLKGIAKVQAKGRTYYYAWRGGPRLKGEPGSPEFVRSYNETIESHRLPDKQRFRSIVVRYKGSPEYLSLANSTRRNWSPWLDRIAKHFGELRIAQFDRPEKIRPVIRQWRGQWSDRPRTADYALQVLSRVLSYTVDPLGKIAANPCEGIARRYRADRSEIIWSDADIAQLKSGCSAEIANAADLAAYSGLRLGDLLRLSWAHVDCVAKHIKIQTGKSGGKRTAIIPLYHGLENILHRIPKRSPIILTNSGGRPWSRDGFGSSFNKAKIKAGLAESNLHFHDLRGTAATLSGPLRRLWAGKRKPWRRSSAGMWTVLLQHAPLSRNLTKQERKLQNGRQNRTPETELSNGAGDGNRTHDIQLGKLSFYH
jgi:integrase